MLLRRLNKLQLIVNIVLPAQHAYCYFTAGIESNFSSILLKNSSNGTVMYEFLVILDIRLTLLKPAFLLVYKIGLALLDEYFSHPLAIAANKDKLFLSFL